MSSLLLVPPGILIILGRWKTPGSTSIEKENQLSNWSPCLRNLNKQTGQGNTDLRGIKMRESSLPLISFPLLQNPVSHRFCWFSPHTYPHFKSSSSPYSTFSGLFQTLLLGLHPSICSPLINTSFQGQQWLYNSPVWIQHSWAAKPWMPAHPNPLRVQAVCLSMTSWFGPKPPFQFYFSQWSLTSYSLDLPNWLLRFNHGVLFFFFFHIPMTLYMVFSLLCHFPPKFPRIP